MKTINNLNKGCILLSVWAMLSCGGDDGGAIINLPPVIENQSFNASENVDDATVIATIQASDPEGETLSFSLAENSEDLFEITSSGELSLSPGSSLDFETTSSHTLTVSVSDGSEEANANITVNVTDVDENLAPTIVDQSFSAAENITDTDVIGTITASDEDGDPLTFSISEDLDNLFELTEQGVLSLQSGKILDFETKTSHTITVQASDGALSTTASITIDVTDFFEAFITKWKTSTTNESIIIPRNASFSYDYTIDWGDGEVDTDLTGDARHTYAVPGTYTVSITGTYPSIQLSTAASRDKIVSIEQWGDIAWESFERAFELCLNLEYNATDAPDLTDVESMLFMFSNCPLINGEIGHWDLSTVEIITGMFGGATAFNGDISTWDVSNVTQMASLFVAAAAFNQDIGSWDVRNVRSFSGMFRDATSFNQDIGGWQLDNVTDLQSMFSGATSFNQDISGWDTDKVVFFTRTFQNASSFNQNLGSWSIQEIVSMEDILDNSGMSTDNYDATLQGWASQTLKKSNVEVGAEGLTYCDGEAARNQLITDNNWMFVDDQSCPR